MTEYIDKEEILKFPIRIHHCDEEHGNAHFIYGIECVMEYIEHKASNKMENSISKENLVTMYNNLHNLKKRGIYYESN